MFIKENLDGKKRKKIYCFYDLLELDLKSTQTTLLDLDWFYDILDLDLKKTLTELTVKQTVI